MFLSCFLGFLRLLSNVFPAFLLGSQPSQSSEVQCPQDWEKHLVKAWMGYCKAAGFQWSKAAQSIFKAIDQAHEHQKSSKTD